MLAALATLPTDPRLAIACALPAAYVGIMVLREPASPALPLLTVALVVMAAAVIRLRRRQGAPG